MEVTINSPQQELLLARLALLAVLPRVELVQLTLPAQLALQVLLVMAVQHKLSVLLALSPQVLKALAQFVRKVSIKMEKGKVLVKPQVMLVFQMTERTVIQALELQK